MTHSIGYRLQARLGRIGEAGGYTAAASGKGAKLSEMDWQAGVFEKGTAASASRFLRGEPMLQAPGPDSMGVVWPVKALVAGSVRYSDRADFSHASVLHLARSGQILRDGAVLALRLVGLKPDTRYYYRTETRYGREDTELGVLHSFRTAGDAFASGGMSFAVINDMAGNTELTARAMQAAAALKPTVTIWNGNMLKALDDRVQATNGFLLPVKGGESASVPVLYVPGPCDCRGAWSEHLSDVMLARSEGERDIRFDRLRYCFALRFGDTALIGLDAGESAGRDAGLLADFASYRDLQTEWLGRELRRADIASARQLVAFVSRPLTGGAPWQKAWGRLLTSAGAKLVVSADAAAYHAEATPADGRSWLQVVGAGAAEGKATLICGKTDGAGRLSVTVRDVQTGRVLTEMTAAARA